jgi:hypothetical protein
MWQTGSFTSSTAYSWEEDFQDNDFIRFACQKLAELASCVENNWDAATQLCSVVVVGLRIFEATGGSSARQLLQRCSDIASRWLSPVGSMSVARG